MSTEPEKPPQPYGDSNDYGYKDDDCVQDGIQDGPIDDKPQPWTGPPPPPPPRET